eukprot:jgi/Astpho2/2520/fgenesh1_pg.00048_%23_37_t
MHVPGAHPHSACHGAGLEFDRISIHCALAAFHMQHGAHHSSVLEGNKHFEEANRLLLAAKHINPTEQMIQIGYGQLQCAKGNIAAASKLFQEASKLMCNGQPCAAGLVAWADTLAERGEHGAALARYRQALQEFPGCPVEVRLGIATCLYRLGQISTARQALQRVLQLDPHNADALYALAVLRLDPLKGESAKLSYSEGLQLLCKAYTAEPENAAVLNLLAHYSIVREEYTEAEKLAEAALATEPAAALKALALLCLGRVAHARGQLRQAFLRYQQAHITDPSLPVARLGRAQALLARKRHLDAVTELEATLEPTSGWIDGLQILSRLYHLYPSRAAKSIPIVKSTAIRSKSPQIYELLGELQAETDPAGALKSFLRAIQLHEAEIKSNGQLANGDAQANGSDSDPGFHRCRNNAAVLAFRCDKVKLAQELIEPVATCEAFAGRAKEVILAFNYARISEAAGDLQDAVTVFKGLLEQCPGYIDSYLRLSAIANLRGNFREAAEWLDRGLDAPGQQDNPDLLCAAAKLCLEREETDQANEYVKRSLAANPKDGYALLIKGQLALQMGQFYVRKHAMKGGDKAAAKSAGKAEENKSKIRQYLAKAMEAYDKVLDQDPGNIYAANGVAAVLGEQGHFMEAQELLTNGVCADVLPLMTLAGPQPCRAQEAIAAREGALQMPDVSLNLAVVFLAQRQFAAATQLLTTILQKQYKNNTTAMLYLARVLYDAGRNSEAKRTLLKAVHLAPTQQELRFNSAVTMQKNAELVFNKPRQQNDPTKLDELVSAQIELNCAAKVFKQLQQTIVRDRRHTPLDVKKLDVHLHYITGALERGNVKVAEAEHEERARAARRRQAALNMEAQRAREQGEAALRGEEERLARQRRDAQVREAQEKLARIKANLKEGEAQQQAAKEGDASKVDKRRKKQKQEAAAEAVFTVDDDEDDGEYQEGEASDAEELDYDSEERRRRLAGTGLESSDDEGSVDAAAAEGDDADPATAASAAAKRLRKKRDKIGKKKRKQEGQEPAQEAGDSASKKSRLKKRRIEEADKADDQAFEDDLAAEEAEDAAAGAGRRQNFFDSDDEAEPIQEVQDAARLASEAAPKQTDSPADNPLANGQMDSTADLFGDDDSD